MKKALVVLTTLCLMASMFLGITVSADDSADTYLGCTDVGVEQWSVLLDYIWAPFTPDKGLVSSVDAYVGIRAGTGTFTIGIYTDYYGKGELLGEVTMECNYDANQVGWQTLTFDTPVAVTPGETYYLRFSSEDVKVTLWGLDSPTANDPYHEWVDAGRAGNGWTNNRLANFLVHTDEAEGDDPVDPIDPIVPVDTYLGCTDVGVEQWSVLLDYIWAPFTPDKGLVSSVDAYVGIRAGTGTFTIGIYTDYYGKGVLLGEVTMDCNYDADQVGWQTLTFDTPVAVTPGETYYLRFASEDVKVTLWGLDSSTPDDPYHEWVDAGRTGGGWTNNRLANFLVCTDVVEDGGDTVYGDVNGDGNVNNRDLGVLQQYLNDYEVTIDLEAADVTHDGNVNNRDLGLLQQYLNDWDVTLEPTEPDDIVYNDTKLDWN